MTELERQHQIEISAAVQAYLGFLRPGVLTTHSDLPSVTVSREETIEAFFRVHPQHRGSLELLSQQYVGASSVVVKREWWKLVSK